MTTDWGIQRCKTALTGLLPKRLDGQRRRQQPVKIHCDVMFDTSAMSLITQQTRPKRQKKELFQIKKKSQANRQQEQITPLFSCQSRWSASPRARRYRRRWIDTGANASRFIPSCKVSIKSNRLAFTARVWQGILTRRQWKKTTFSNVCVTRASLRPWLAERARTTVLKKERKERKNRIMPYWFCWTS